MKKNCQTDAGSCDGTFSRKHSHHPHQYSTSYTNLFNYRNHMGTGQPRNNTQQGIPFMTLSVEIYMPSKTNLRRATQHSTTRAGPTN
eukprot:11280715-Ditylum_brightwellii.AAC.1